MFGVKYIVLYMLHTCTLCYSDSTIGCQVSYAMYAMYYLTEGGEGDIVNCGERDRGGTCQPVRGELPTASMI